MTQKFSPSHFRIQTRSQRRSEGPRPRRLTKAHRHLNVPWEHTSLIELQTLLKLKVGVCTHETLDKVLTEPVCPLGVDPTLDRPAMLTCRRRTGQEHDLEDYPPELRPGFEECLDPDMNIRFHALFVKIPVHDLSYHCAGCGYLSCK